MKTSFATYKIKQTRNILLFKIFLFIGIYFLLSLSFYVFYVLAYYLNVPFRNFFLNNLSFLYDSNRFFRISLFVSIFLIISLIGIILLIILYFIYNNRYQKIYLKTIFNELKLNEIYQIEKGRIIEDHKFEIINKFLNIDEDILEKNYLFSLNSLIKMDFYQYINKPFKKRYNGVMITSTLEHRFNEFLQFRFDEITNVDNYEEKTINQFPLTLFKNSSTYIYINSTLGKNTYKIIDEKILNELNLLKKFTKSNFILTLTNYELNLYIENWELTLTDNLFSRLDFEAIDKKVEALTFLIDNLIDIYIYISRNVKEK